jgi:DNA polymerase-1
MLNIPEVNRLLEIRKFKKIRDTYLESFLREQVDGFLHPFFNLHIVTSFRSSSSSPNFQNIPKRDERAMNICRGAILPREGNQLFSVDYGGIEVAMACCYTEDPQLIHDYVEGDMHRDMAIELFLLDEFDKSVAGLNNFRQASKNGFVFPEFYGDYYLNCAHNLLKWMQFCSLRDGTPGLIHLKNKGLITLDKKGYPKNINKFIKHVEGIEDNFWNVRYKKYMKWKKRTWKDYQKKGYVELKTGFKCKGLMKRNEALNVAFQGSGFHCLLNSFIKITDRAEELNMKSHPIGQIHDEIVNDVHPDELELYASELKRIMVEEVPNEWKWIIVPLSVEGDISDIDTAWNMKKSYKFS